MLVVVSPGVWARSLFLVETRDDDIHGAVESVDTVRYDAATDLSHVRDLDRHQSYISL